MVTEQITITREENGRVPVLWQRLPGSAAQLLVPLSAQVAAGSPALALRRHQVLCRRPTTGEANDLAECLINSFSWSLLLGQPGGLHSSISHRLRCGSW